MMEYLCKPKNLNKKEKVRFLRKCHNDEKPCKLSFYCNNTTRNIKGIIFLVETAQQNPADFLSSHLILISSNHTKNIVLSKTLSHTITNRCAGPWRPTLKLIDLLL